MINVKNVNLKWIVLNVNVSLIYSMKKYSGYKMVIYSGYIFIKYKNGYSFLRFIKLLI